VFFAADLSPEMLARVDKRDADFVRADFAHLPVHDNTFDLVVCGLAIGHVVSLPHALRSDRYTWIILLEM
jgi:ubiquinone/menaquinone biosynthesis C-methylase UbiE